MEDRGGKTTVVQAAGGIVWRSSPAGRRIAVIHRARYGDWTLPKGKLKPGESWERTALREVGEEIGCSVRLADFAGSVSYVVDSAPKVVLFWNMELVEQREFQPSEEVSEVIWMSAPEALRRLDHPGEKTLLSDSLGPGASAAFRRTRGGRSRHSASVSRLANTISAYQEELEYLIVMQPSRKNKGDMLWSGTSRALIRRAEEAIEAGDEDRGWRCLHAAQRMSLFGMDDLALRAKAVEILREGTAKLREWRIQAIRDSLCVRDGTELKAGLSATEVFHASQVLHEHFANVYYRLRLLRRQLATLALGGVLAVAGVVCLWVSRPAPLLLGSDIRSDHQAVLLSVVLFGVMGVSMSGILSLAREGAGSPIPEHLTNLWVTLARFVVGAIGAIAIYTFVFAGLLPLGEASPGLILAASFAGGFSEKFVVQAVEALSPRKKG